MREYKGMDLSRIIDIILPTKKKEHKLKEKGYGYWAKKITAGQTEDGIVYVFRYKDEEIKNIIWNMKFYKDKESINFLAEILSNFIKEKYTDETEEEILVGYIPQTDFRKKENDFNHLKTIANKIEKQENIKVIHNLLKFKRKVKRQSRLKTKEEKTKNINNSMQANDITENKICIIFDDVTTTGQTLKEAKRALKEKNAKKIIIIAIAH